jgi:hypothetical protein
MTRFVAVAGLSAALAFGSLAALAASHPSAGDRPGAVLAAKDALKPITPAAGNPGKPAKPARPAGMLVIIRACIQEDVAAQADAVAVKVRSRNAHAARLIVDEGPPVALLRRGSEVDLKVRAGNRAVRLVGAARLNPPEARPPRLKPRFGPLTELSAGDLVVFRFRASRARTTKVSDLPEAFRIVDHGPRPRLCPPPPPPA